MKRTTFCLLSVSLFPLLSSTALAQQTATQNSNASDNYASENFAESPTQMIRGGVGLIQTPTARMSTEGDFNFNYSDINEYRFWTASIQLFPWMESTVRYSDVRTRLYSPFPGFSGDQTLKDKGIDVKFRLVKESFYLPEISVGLTDIGGTGLFSSEFITMSKAYGDFDFHLGLGSGYLGTAGNISNPFCQLSDSYCDRPSGTSGLGGKIEFNEFFKGDTSLFGGIEYQTPLEGLSLKLEYEGNDYSRDTAGVLAQGSKWNVGAVYQYQNWDFALSYQRGNTFGFNISYKINFNTIQQVKFDQAPRNIIASEPASSMQELDRRRLYNDLVNEGSFLLNATHQEDDEMIFYGIQLGYRNHDEATQRVGRIIASELPDSIKNYSIVDTVAHTPMVETKIDADAFKQAARLEALETDISATYIRQNPSDIAEQNYEPTDLSGPLLSVDSFWIQTFGNPEAFYLYQGGAILSTGYVFNPKFSFRTSAKITLVENFDKFNFLRDAQQSTLPRVRTLIREYVSGRNIALETAYAHYFDKLSENTFIQVYGGYLETMFGGVGTEIMYRPVDSSIYFGLDLNYVKQRDFDSETAFLDYSTFTGHASVFWEPEFLPNMQLSVSAGQFLAKDKGVNIDIAKRFDTGIVVGAYAAFTNVSAAEYGEGSFTKGFYISIPFDMFSFAPAKGRGKIPWVPIGRDGGQMLNRPLTLRAQTELRSPFYD